MCLACKRESKSQDASLSASSSSASRLSLRRREPTVAAGATVASAESVEAGHGAPESRAASVGVVGVSEELHTEPTHPRISLKQ